MNIRATQAISSNQNQVIIYNLLYFNSFNFYIIANRFKELVAKRFIFQKAKDNIILEIDPEKVEINFIWKAGEIFYKIKDIDRDSDPAKTINSAITKVSDFLHGRADAVKSLV